MEQFTPSEVGRYYRFRVPDLRFSGREWRGTCRIHNGKDPNFAVNSDTGLWHCFSQCGRGGDILDFEQALTGIDFVTARREVYAIVGRDLPSTPKRTLAERRRFARQNARAEQLAIAAQYWHRETMAELQLRKEGAPELSRAWIASCQTLYDFERMGARELLEAYLRASREQPSETARRVAAAESKERECARLAAEIVHVIAAYEKQ